MKEDDNRIDKTYSVSLSPRILLLYNYLLVTLSSIIMSFAFCQQYGSVEKRWGNFLN